MSRVSIDELGFGDEIRGVVCPECGGSLVWYEGKKPICMDDGFVTPVKEEVSRYSRLNDEDRRWLEEHGHELESEIE